MSPSLTLLLMKEQLSTSSEEYPYETDIKPPFEDDNSVLFSNRQLQILFLFWMVKNPFTILDDSPKAVTVLL